MWFSIISSRMIQFQMVMDTVALETEEKTFQREQNERDALDAVGNYKCAPGMSPRRCLRLLT
jgi:hypothetical protein